MLKGWKTYVVAFAVTVVGALQAMDWATIIPDADVAGWVIFGIGVVMGALRKVTNTPPAV